MKKLLLIPLSFLLMFLSGCQLLFMSNKNMLKYYVDNDNYGEVIGEVIEKNVAYATDSFQSSCLLTIEVSFGAEFYKKDGLEIELPINDYFEIFGHEELYVMVDVGDVIKFVSAPRIFYDGHNKPIVSLSKDGQTMLSFEKGKADYIEWIIRTW